MEGGFQTNKEAEYEEEVAIVLLPSMQKIEVDNFFWCRKLRYTSFLMQKIEVHKFFVAFLSLLLMLVCADR